MRLYKYHALGNDYLILDDPEAARSLTPQSIRRICHRHYGVGSDGILVREQATHAADFSVRIVNPDGSVAEKSGNGLRIFARYLSDVGAATADRFTVSTAGGRVTCRIGGGDRRLITVDMGQVSFDSDRIPVTGPSREVLGEQLTADGREFEFSAATVGNPHCVILLDEISEAVARRYGPAIERDARFPQRTNVQFGRVHARDTLQIEIWERGAGYTLSSGSSSCAAAAVAHRLGLVDAQVTVQMPGGRLHLEIAENFAVTMTGPATRVAEIELHPEALEDVG